ncbi:MAG: SMI1/KNR4 family protein [Campylobacteraceae bacterium]|jgi:hypothetical protein|nr:SMI1/KNR4 family protein [Campylobacteraceae bacterium]
MDIIQKIKTLYNISKDYGYSENEIIEAENNLGIKFPKILREYYLIFGKNKTINESFNRLLNINGEIGFTDDSNYLVFYEENQGAVYWAVDKKDMGNNNPKVYGNYDPNNGSDNWLVDSETMEGFLLSMAYWNGALEGLQYTANYSNDDGIENNIIKNVENYWNEIKGITNQQLRFFTNDDIEIIILTTDLENNANGIYVGTNDKNKFMRILEKINIKWDYRSDKDNE